MSQLPYDLQSALSAYDLKPDGGPEWRCNSPLRANANAHSFRINADKETYFDHVSQERGNFHQLRVALGLAPVESDGRIQIANTKRAYRDLAEYAAAHGIDEETLAAAGWTQGTWQNRPCLFYPTQTGDRVRFIDGDKPTYKPTEYGMKACWYGLQKAALMAAKTMQPIVLCNGEISTIAAQKYGLAAFARTGGEQRLSDDLVNQLKAVWQGDVIIALDCDVKGRKTAAEIATQLSGFCKPRIIDLGLSDKGDLADFCKLHTVDSPTVLKTLAQDKPAYEVNNVIESNPTTAMGAGQTMDELIRRLDIQTVMDGTPVVIPFRSFHYLGGFAKVVKPGKIVGIIAPSGNGKTSFLETWGDLLNKAGNDGVMHGDEWSPSEYAERRVQRYGGATLNDMAEWEIWKKEHRDNIPKEYRLGRELPIDTDVKSLQIANSIKQWKGQMTYFPGSGRTFDGVLEDMSKTIFEQRALGRSVTFAMFDYIQLFEPSVQDNTVNRHEYALELVKRWAQANSIVAFVGSQVTKAATRDTKGGVKLIDTDAAQFIRDDKFNMFVSLNLHYIKETDDEGREREVMTGLATAAVIKNSTGKTGNIPLKTGFSNLTWHEVTK